MLDNCFEDCGNVQLVGIAFDGDQKENVRSMFAKSTSGKPAIALVHSPDTFPLLPPEAVLTCASHTHGGQVRLPFLGALLVPCTTGSRYARGLFQEHGKTLVVTSGIGTSILPLRLLCPPEIVVITIRVDGTVTGQNRAI